MSSRPSTLAPPSVAISSASRAVIASGPKPTRCSSIACRASASMLLVSLEAEPSTPSPTGTPASRMRRTGAMPEASRMFEQGQWATPVPVRAKRPMPCVVELDAVRVPDVGADPAELLGIFGRRAAELLAAVGDVVVVLGQMGVQRHAVAARQHGRLAHQVVADRERRARRDARCAASRSGPGRGRSRSAAGVSARIAASSSTSASGGRPPLLSPTLIEPRARVKAHADLGGGLDAVVEPDAVRVDVEVVAGWWCSPTAAARPSRSGSRPRTISGVSRGPDRVERAQPAEQLAVLRGRHHAGQALVHVVVRVDEAGDHDVAGQVDHLVGCAGMSAVGPTASIRLPSHEDAAAGDLAPLARPS